MRLKITPTLRPFACHASVLHLALMTIAAMLFVAPALHAQEKFKETRSGAQYVHHIQLYDAAGVLIDPTAPDARPYSPRQTCMKCHDYNAISHGYHFNAAMKIATGDTSANSAAGDAAVKPTDRPGEPWIHTDARSGTQIPLSYRQREGLFHPSQAGLTRFKFLTQFGRHMPGGGVGDVASAEAKPQAATGDDAAPQPADDESRFKFTGHLDIDCMMCHSNTREYSHERWIKQINEQNFEWAATYALGIATVKGSTKALPNDFDPKAEGAAEKLPKTKYRADRFDGENYTFFDIVGKPTNNSCLQCHSTRPVGEGAQPRWVHDGDVHIRAGMACADCHRNDLAHHTVRGYEGEKHPTGINVHTLTCAGCHMDDDDATTHSEIGGRLGAPKPLHKGIPPIHFDLMSCTSCHSGLLPQDKPGFVQTSMAHAFGEAHQMREDADLPGIVQPVFLKDATGKVTPHRVVWPAYWAWQTDDKLSPMDGGDVYTKVLRRVLRIRSDFRTEASKATLTADDRKAALGDAAAKPDAELNADEKAKLDEALKKKSAETFNANVAKVLVELGKTKPSPNAVPVYIASGKLFKLVAGDTNNVTSETHPAANYYAWPLGHDVRPARQSLGVTGCTECHAKDSPIFYSAVTPTGPATDAAPVTVAMHELMKQDVKLLQAWEQSFGGRPIFKWVGFITIGGVALIVLLFALLGLNGLLKIVTRRS